MSRKRIVYLPVDSRPCNYSWPVQLVGWAGAECIVPAQEQMDEFRKPAAFADTEAFLLANTERADAFVISVDHLCYGSLLASRNFDANETEALRRLELIRRIKAAAPDTPVYAYSVIMRSSLSTLCASDLDAYRNMTALSVNRGRADREREQGNPKSAEKYDRLADLYESRLPKEILEKYMAVRRRNFAVNAACIHLMAEKVLTGLQLLQEDSEPYGFHKKEQRLLDQMITRLGIGQVRIHNGTDEGGMMMTAAALYGSEEKAPIRVLYTRGSGKFTARYEDRPFAGNVADMMHELNLKENRTANQVLVIHAPRFGRQKEARDETEDPAVPGIAASIAKLAGSGRWVYVLDVAFANGGSRQLVDCLRKQGTLPQLAGYAAWNTASNSLGTSLAQILFDAKAGRINKNFLWERLLDDMLYQRVIRREAETVLVNEGFDPYALPDRNRAEQLISERFAHYLAAEEWPVSHDQFLFRQPWTRTFETDVRLIRPKEN